MFENYSKEALQAIELAEEESQNRGASYVSTEHLLIGILKKGSSFSSTLLNSRNINLSSVRNELDKITSSLDKLGKGRMMKKSDLSNLYDE